MAMGLRIHCRMNIYRYRYMCIYKKVEMYADAGTATD